MSLTLRDRPAAVSPPSATRCPRCRHLPASATVICPQCSHDRRPSAPASYCPYRGKACDCGSKPYCMTDVS